MKTVLEKDPLHPLWLKEGETGCSPVHHAVVGARPGGCSGVAVQNSKAPSPAVQSSRSPGSSFGWLTLPPQVFRKQEGHFL